MILCGNYRAACAPYAYVKTRDKGTMCIQYDKDQKDIDVRLYMFNTYKTECLVPSKPSLETLQDLLAKCPGKDGKHYHCVGHSLCKRYETYQKLFPMSAIRKLVANLNELLGGLIHSDNLLYPTFRDLCAHPEKVK